MSRKKKPTPTADATPLPPAVEKVYRGRRTAGGAVVTVVEDGVERPLELRLDLRRHSPTGFGWSYAGSGPAQLALALAADALGDDDRAQAVHQRLKAAVVAGLPADGWELTADQVRAAVREVEQNRRPGHPATDEPRPREDRTTSEDEAAVAPPSRAPDPETDAASGEGEVSHLAAHRPDGPRRPNPFGFRQDAAAGVRLLEDRQFKQMQLKFAEKPSAAVRQAVHEAGYKWREEELAWTKQIDKDNGWQTRADAEALFERVAAMIRAEKGITHEYT